MPTGLGLGSYISNVGLYLIYRELAEEGRIPKKSRAWKRMKELFKQLSMLETTKYPLIKEN